MMNCAYTSAPTRTSGITASLSEDGKVVPLPSCVNLVLQWMPSNTGSFGFSQDTWDDFQSISNADAMSEIQRKVSSIVSVRATRSLLIYSQAFFVVLAAILLETTVSTEVSAGMLSWMLYRLNGMRIMADEITRLLAQHRIVPQIQVRQLRLNQPNADSCLRGVIINLICQKHRVKYGWMKSLCMLAGCQ